MERRQLNATKTVDEIYGFDLPNRYWMEALNERESFSHNYQNRKPRVHCSVRKRKIKIYRRSGQCTETGPALYVSGICSAVDWESSNRTLFALWFMRSIGVRIGGSFSIAPDETTDRRARQTKIENQSFLSKQLPEAETIYFWNFSNHKRIPTRVASWLISSCVWQLLTQLWKLRRRFCVPT